MITVVSVIGAFAQPSAASTKASTIRFMRRRYHAPVILSTAKDLRREAGDPSPSSRLRMTGRMNLRTRPFAAACSAMFLFGIVLAMLGTIFGLPTTRDRLHVDLAQQGDIFLALYLGVFLSTLLVGPVIDSFGNKVVLGTSALLVAAAFGFFS